MNKIVNTVFDVIELVTEKCGQAACLLAMVMMSLVAYEVVARYFFNSPTIFAWPLTRQVMGIFALFGGVYAMKNSGHIRIEILYERLPPKFKQVARSIGLIAMTVFLVILIWQSGWMGLNSLQSGERSPDAVRIPLYIIKLTIPGVGLLFLLQGIVTFFRHKD